VIGDVSHTQAEVLDWEVGVLAVVSALRFLMALIRR